MIEAVTELEKRRQIDKIWIVIMQIWMIFIDIGRSGDREFLDSMVLERITTVHKRKQMYNVAHIHASFRVGWWYSVWQKPLNLF